MAKRSKQRTSFVPPPETLPARIERAQRENRFHQALELARQLYKSAPSADHLHLLHRAALGRARQFRESNHLRDAATTLEAALTTGQPAQDLLTSFAAELAACGSIRGAQNLLNRLPPDDSSRPKILALFADHALQSDPPADAQLPPALAAEVALVRRALAQVEAGQDDAARDTLQALGLRSPLAEWKLFLRGLIAFYTQDDPRALENWQRLDSARLPARLAAPFRFLIDPAFAAAQRPEAQKPVQAQLDRLLGQGLVQQLRAIHTALLDTKSLGNAFRLAETVVPALKQQSPALTARLASCYYWAVIIVGRPEDVARYQRVFGPPHDDPSFARLRALALEHAGDMAEAHREWQKFDKDVAAHPQAWPTGQLSRVRALVWARMGKNAAAQPNLEDLPLPPFLRDHPDRPRPLHPGAEQCLKRSLELAPDRLDTHIQLVDLYHDKGDRSRTEQAARDLLARFPNHVPTLVLLAENCLAQHQHDEAVELFRRALAANPLDARIRRWLATAHLFRARNLAEAGRFDDARAEFQTALALGEGSQASVYCKMAACEFKAGEPDRAEEYLRQAALQSPSRLDVAFSMLIEAIRLKLPAALKTRFQRDFDGLLRQPPDPAGAAALARIAASHAAAGIEYRGRKTHEKKTLDHLKKAKTAAFSEAQLEQICDALKDLKSVRLLREYAERGQRLYPQNPWFYVYEIDSYQLGSAGRGPGMATYRIRFLIDQARRLAAGLPTDKRKEQLQEALDKAEAMILPLPGFLHELMDRFMDSFPGGFPGFEDEDDFDDEFDDGCPF